MKHLLLTTIAAVLLVGCTDLDRPEDSIHVAAKGDIEAVKQHLAAGVDVNAGRSDGGGTLLHYAAANGHKEIVELLICSENLILAFGKLHL
jgi:ankyrin repeat protein